MSKDSPIIMVVEDEELLLKAISKKLELQDIRTVTCTSGSQAVDYLLSMVETDDLPDAVWLDYHLKDMDGLAFMSEIKKNEALTDIPVLVVSNSASSEKVNNMLALGAKKYLLKAEYRLDDIISQLREYIVESE